MSNGWRAVCYIVAVVLFVLHAFAVRFPRVAPGWAGLAVFALPAAWDAAEAS
jgi:hypothetical protein